MADRNAHSVVARTMAAAAKWGRGLALKSARLALGSRQSNRFAWARWGLVRGRALGKRRRIFRRLNVEWDVPGHARAVTTEITGPGPGEVMVRTIASAISPGTERAFFRLEAGIPAFPSLPGYSLAGEVCRVGSGDVSVRMGDLVATQAPHGSLVVRPAHLVFPVPDAVPPTQAAFLYLGMIVLHGLWRGELRPSEKVAVLGRGTIGSLAALIARAQGAGEVISIAPSRRHVIPALAEAGFRIIATKEEREAVLEDVQADLTLESSGEAAAVGDAVRVTRPGGRVVLLGSPRSPTTFDFTALAARRIRLVGAHVSTLDVQPEGSNRSYARAAEVFLGYLADRRLDLQGLVGEEVNPWEAGGLYRQLARHRPGWVGAVFRWDLLPEDHRLQEVAFWRPPDTELVRGVAMRRLPYPAGFRTVG